MVTDAFALVALRLALAWPAPLLLARGLAGRATADDDVPGVVPVSLAG
jgi:hypothetical protein